LKSAIYISILLLSSCSPKSEIKFDVIDTNFSKGRLTHQQTLNIDDLEKFHGHLCDGLVLGALAIHQAMLQLYPNEPIDRTNLRMVSKPSPCLTDVAIYLTGARYQFSTFYVDTAFDGLYIVQRLDNLKAFSISLNKGVKPTAIDSLGALAANQQLTACGIDSLRKLEDDFTTFLLSTEPHKIFTVKQLKNFDWNPVYKTFAKTDILNKTLEHCKN